jgi:hypothetical protein
MYASSAMVFFEKGPQSTGQEVLKMLGADSGAYRTFRQRAR